MSRWWERASPARNTFPLHPSSPLNSTYAIIENERVLNHNLVTSCQLKHAVFRDPRAYSDTPRDPDLIWNGLRQTDVFLSMTEPTDVGCELEDYFRDGSIREFWYRPIVLYPLITVGVMFVILAPLALLRHSRQRRKDMQREKDKGLEYEFEREDIQPTPRSRAVRRPVARLANIVVCCVLGGLSLCYPLMLYFGFDLWSPGCVLSKVVYNSYFGTFSTTSTGTSYTWDLSEMTNRVDSYWKKSDADSVLTFPGVGEISPTLDMMSRIFEDLKDRNILFSSARAAMKLPWSALFYTDRALSQQKFTLPIWTLTGGSKLSLTAARGADGIQLNHRLAGQILAERTWSIDQVFGEEIALVSTLLSTQVIPTDLHQSITQIVEYGYVYVAKVRELLDDILKTLDKTNNLLLRLLSAVYGHQESQIAKSDRWSVAEILRLSTIIVPCLIAGVMTILMIRTLASSMRRSPQPSPTAQNIEGVDTSRRSYSRPLWYVGFYVLVSVFLLFALVTGVVGMATRQLARNCNFLANRLFEDSAYSEYPYLNEFSKIHNGESADIEMFEICLYKNSTSGNLFERLDQWNSWNDVFKTVNQILVETSEVLGADLISNMANSFNHIQAAYPSEWIRYVDEMNPNEWAVALPDLTHFSFLAKSQMVFATDLQTTQLLMNNHGGQNAETDSTGPQTPLSLLQDEHLKSALRVYLTENSDRTVPFPSLSNKPLWQTQADQTNGDILDQYGLYSPMESTNYLRSLIPEECANRVHVCVEWDQFCVTDLISKSIYPLPFGYKTIPYINVDQFKSEEDLFTSADNSSSSAATDASFITDWFENLARRTSDDELSNLFECISTGTMTRPHFIELINALYLTVPKSLILNDVQLVRSSDNYLLQNEEEGIELCVIGQPCHLYHIQSGQYTNIYSKTSYVRRLKNSLLAAYKMQHQDVNKVFMHAYASINAPTRLWKSVDAFQAKLDCRQIRNALFALHGSVCNRTGPSLVLLTTYLLTCSIVLGISIALLFFNF